MERLMEYSLLQKMKYAQQLTAQEKHIVDHILNNPEVVFESTAYELAQATYTSSSTIVRLCKKLGTHGYPDFQLKLALDYQRAPATLPPANHPFIELEDVRSAMDSVPYLYHQALEETRRLLNVSVLQRIANWVKESGRIDIYGSDMNYYLAQQACTKWNELGISAIAHNSGNMHYLNTMNPNVSTLSFVISHTGENQSMVDVAKILNGKNMNVIAITGNNHSSLSRQSTETLLSYGYNEQMRLSKMSSMVSVLYIFDILYMSSIRDSY
ncbi:MurR/RpiR family transcriptional regulator [Paenibacillus illinoisensis]|uniref:MurR/RpiR family transcriptional regulator n=1 Tax=Paenibacillus illinoisensis TaxID=59845 RepID=UPI001FE43C9B|nr:MurR/RpiR family transcriptional regulator [Paenibacillus illinoisensis]